MSYLTKEQIAYLEKRVQILEVSRASISESIADEVREFKVGSEDSLASSVFSSKESLAAIDREINDIRTVLATAVVPEYDSEKIAVGTNFTAALEIKGEIVEEKYTLVESNPIFDDSAEYMQISVGAPIGAAVLGKKVNEPFQYQAPAGIFKGVITAIEPQKIKEEELSKQKTIGTHPSMKRGK